MNLPHTVLYNNRTIELREGAQQPNGIGESSATYEGLQVLIDGIDYTSSVVLGIGASPEDCLQAAQELIDA